LAQDSGSGEENNGRAGSAVPARRGQGRDGLAAELLQLGEGKVATGAGGAALVLGEEGAAQLYWGNGRGGARRRSGLRDEGRRDSGWRRIAGTGGGAPEHEHEAAQGEGWRGGGIGEREAEGSKEKSLSLTRKRAR